MNISRYATSSTLDHGFVQNGSLKEPAFEPSGTSCDVLSVICINTGSRLTERRITNKQSIVKVAHALPCRGWLLTFTMAFSDAERSSSRVTELQRQLEGRMAAYAAEPQTIADILLSSIVEMQCDMAKAFSKKPTAVKEQEEARKVLGEPSACVDCMVVEGTGLFTLLTLIESYLISIVSFSVSMRKNPVTFEAVKHVRAEREFG